MRRRAAENRPAGGGRVGAWLRQHGRAFLFSLGQMRRAPGNTLLTTAVIGISLALPAGFYSFLENARRAVAHWDAAPRISLFLRQDVAEQQARELAQRLRGRLDVAEAEVISRAAALAEYRQHSGFGAALDALDHNPLPVTLVVRAGDAADEQLAEDLGALPEVEYSQFDQQWARRLHQVIAVLQRAIAGAAALLALAAALVVGNTIRLAMHNRRREIEINKLFGATDAFIGRPFLYAGLFHGVGGSLLAWLLLESAVLLLAGPVARLAELYDARFALVGISAGAAVKLLLCGAGLGLAGSWLSVKYYLRVLVPA